ncbi:hypothetical protein Tco_1348814 [Tanacetum coccineum]
MATRKASVADISAINRFCSKSVKLVILVKRRSTKRQGGSNRCNKIEEDEGEEDDDERGCACQLLGGKLVCWSAKKQQSMAMSSAEAEYVAAVGCCANIL